MQTSNFSAEFGQTGGGVINMTHQVRHRTAIEGLGYWYHRNPPLNAAPFSTATVNRAEVEPRAASGRPDLRRPDADPGTLGGYDGRNRTFFFAASNRATTTTSTPFNVARPHRRHAARRFQQRW